MTEDKFYFNEKRQEVRLRKEILIDNTTFFWEQIKGISYSLTERQYKNRLKKYLNLKI